MALNLAQSGGRPFFLPGIISVSVGRAGIKLRLSLKGSIRYRLATYETESRNENHNAVIFHLAISYC